MGMLKIRIFPLEYFIKISDSTFDTLGKVASSFNNSFLRLAVALLRRGAASGGGRLLQEAGTCQRGVCSA